MDNQDRRNERMLSESGCGVYCKIDGGLAFERSAKGKEEDALWNDSVTAPTSHQEHRYYSRTKNAGLHRYFLSFFSHIKNIARDIDTPG